MSRFWLVPVLTVLYACNGKEPVDPVDTDTVDTTDPDPVVDNDGTFAQATEAPPVTTAGVPVALGPADQIDIGDHDFYAVDLTQGVPYHLWVDTGPNVRCDTILRVYNIDATVPATATLEGEACTLQLGDQAAVSDDMILRYRQSDPGLVFVPETSGRYFIEVMNYDEAVAKAPVGGPWCTYTAYAMKRSPTEVEPNNTEAVTAALIAADDASAGYPDTVVTPALQPLAPNPFLLCEPGTTCGEEFSGWISDAADSDLWQYRFGSLEACTAEAVANPQDAGCYQKEVGDERPGVNMWWTFSLWQTLPGHAGVRLELLDKDLAVVASTDDPVPDGHYGFVNDVGLLYPVTPFSTWYLRVSHPTPPLGGAFYVGVSQGYNRGIVDCNKPDPVITGWESESDRVALAKLKPTDDPPTNDDFGHAELVRFCQVGVTTLYASSMAGYIDPEGDPVRFVPLEDATDTGVGDEDVTFRCGDQSNDACPDREVFAILPTSHAGELAARHLMLTVQAKTVGSYLEPEVFLFSNNERIRPFDTSSDTTVGAATRLGPGDVSIDTVTPDDAEQIFIVIQAKSLHPTDRRANGWFLRMLIEDQDPNAVPELTTGQECKL